MLSAHVSIFARIMICLTKIGNWVVTAASESISVDRSVFQGHTEAFRELPHCDYRSGTVNSNTVSSKFHQFEEDLTGV